MSSLLPLLLSGLVGFLSLSKEILWVRVASFSWHTQPPGFAFVLAFYLLGIAAGAAAGKTACARTRDLYGAAALALAAAGLLDVCLPALIGWLMPPRDDVLLAPALMIAGTAAACSVLFPIVHHLGSQASGPRVGRSVSRVYFANIVGATLGPLVTGFVALDHLSVDDCFRLSGGLSVLAAAVCALRAHGGAVRQVALAAGALTLGIGLACAALPGGTVLARMAQGSDAVPLLAMTTNRQGVIHVLRSARGDVVFGGNVYDGVADVDVDANPNRLDRAYLGALLAAHPRRVLFVGVSTGAWARCYLGVPGLEHMDLVEINPGFPALIRRYPRLAPLLADPRVQLHIDDGRRWLRRHPQERYDVIVQNTSYYWRSGASSLLSREYMEEVRQHLLPGGVVEYNTTGSPDVLVTAQAVYAHAYRYANFVYAADTPLHLDPGRLERVQRPDGRLFRLADAPRGSVAFQLTHLEFSEVPVFLRRRQTTGSIITDDNLLVEYRDGERFGPVILHAVLPPLTPTFLDSW